MTEFSASLLGDRFAPVTSSMGFLKAPIEEVDEALVEWRTRVHGSAMSQKLAGGLVKHVHLLEPLTGGVRPRELIVATQNPEWTALFDCGVQGGDQSTTVGYLARTMHVYGAVVVSVPDVADRAGGPASYGARQFEMFGPVATQFLNYVRTVSVVRDGVRWRFDANGTVQDFEDEQAYKHRRVSERFTSSMLVRYAEALGLQPFEPNFFRGPTALVVSPVSPPPGALVLSLAEAQRRAGIKAAG